MKAFTGSDVAICNEFITVMQGVGKSFDECLNWSLREITFGVRRGEIFGFVGPSDAGKTTILKLLAGHLRPTEGNVKVFGSSPRRRVIKSRIGYLPQMSGSSSQGNSGGMLDWFGDFFKGSKDRKKIEAEKSGGKIRWRTDLAHTIFGKRDLAIFDDPFSNLDSSERDELKNLILTLAQMGKTVVLSSSSLEDIWGVCQRIAVLNAGHVEAIGTLDELQSQPGIIRALAPVLPQPVAEKLQNIVRQYLTGAINSGTNSVQSEKSSVNWEQENSHTSTSTNFPASESFPAPAPSENSGTGSDPINHEKLSKLLLRKTTLPPPKASPKTVESFDEEARANEKLSTLVAKSK